MRLMTFIDDCPAELAVAIKEFWPVDEWDNAAHIAQLESSWNAFALNDTTDAEHRCGAPLPSIQGIPVVAEHSVGYFQINSCNFPGWEWARLYNARHNAGTAHMLWEQAGGWSPWAFSSAKL